MAGPFVAAANGIDIAPEDDAQAFVSRAVDVAYGRDRPPNLTLSARQGDAARILIEESKTAQLLVIGSRGLGEVAGLLLGSVSAHCAEKAHCPGADYARTRSVMTGSPTVRRSPTGVLRADSATGG